MWGRPVALGLACLGAMSLVGGCALPERRASFRSPDPQERTLAVGESVASGDQRSVPDLIEMLASTDPAERMVAIGALQRLTGETRGYHYWAQEPERRRAIEEWVRWYRARSATGSAEGADAGAGVPASASP